MKKFLAMLLALCLMLGLMAGCGGDAASSVSSASTEENETVAPTENGDAEVSVAEDGSTVETPGEDGTTTSEGPTAHAIDVFGIEEAPESVSYPLDSDESLELMATFPDPLFASYPNGMADCQIYIEAEKATGVKIEYTPLSTSASSEQFNIIMASGEYPDLIGWGLNYSAGDDSAVEEEVYLDLTEYIAEYAPNYWSILSCDDELLDTAITDGGYITGFHGVRTEKGLETGGMVIRTDLLDEAGLDKPYTIEEYENVLATFKDMGIEQPLVMLASGAIQGNFLAGAFDVAAFCNSFPQSVAPTYVVDGEIKFGPLEDGFKEYITLVKEWYDKGYIHSDFITVNTNWNSPDYANAITGGEAGIFYADQGNLGGYNDGSEIEGFAVEATYDMHASEDSVNHFGQYRNKAVGNGFHITTACDNIELACRWGDWWYTEEGSLLANYGVEGVSFDRDADGNPYLNETVTDAPEGMRDALLIYASNDTICCVIDPNAVTSGYSEVDKVAPEVWDEGVDDAYVIPTTVSLSAEETTDAANIYSDIETLCLESIAKFINGDKSMDEFDAFVESLYDMNIEGYLEIQQGAYDRAMGK